MLRNEKQMKLEETRFTKLSKLNAPNKQALGQEYEVSEGANQKVWDNQKNILQWI